jgi:hypothetical protein
MKNKTISKYLAKLGAEGGKRAAERMTPTERTDRARRAALVRHGKKRSGKK